MAETLQDKKKKFTQRVPLVVHFKLLFYPTIRKFQHLASEST